ncbi:MAG: enoyl-CoA hydratase-related protein [Nitrospirota bacterium]|nr:enoyl-CoA hydratase-related protein [Nitrospirota bacterium]
MTIGAQSLTCSVENSIATVTLNHPPVNALTPELLTELELALQGLAKDDAVKVVIITGTGRNFVAGADITFLATLSTAKQGMEMALRGQAVLHAIECFEKPVLAAINGTCLGGGLELALCCHIRVAAEGARLGLPEINLGIIPGFGGTQRLARLIGVSKALQMILTGDPISAAEAKALGIVSQVVPPEDLLRQTEGLARRIASKGLLAAQTALRAVREGLQLSLPEALYYEAGLFGELCESMDKREGVAAFLEKRQPDFRGR